MIPMVIINTETIIKIIAQTGKLVTMIHYPFFNLYPSLHLRQFI
jgi:hypothetical protein